MHNKDNEEHAKTYKRQELEDLEAEVIKDLQKQTRKRCKEDFDMWWAEVDPEEIGYASHQALVKNSNEHGVLTFESDYYRKQH